MARTVLFGSTGRLGTAILQRLGKVRDMLHPTEDELDLTDGSAVRDLLAKSRPDAIINAAAYTDVDGAESNEGLAYRLNADLAGDLARLAREIGALFVHFSTDFVFDGLKDCPYTEEDTPSPVSVYGRSKLAGEEAVRSELSENMYLLVRTSWLFAPWGPSFPANVLKWAGKGTVRAPVDVLGSPTYAIDLADALARLLDRDARGLYHVANSGVASRHAQARRVVEVAGLDVVVEEASASDFPASAPRPQNSALSTGKYVRETGPALPPWEDAVAKWYEEYRRNRSTPAPLR
jgi:dTDP-4-dehydrorhamnose reductase